MKPLGKKINEYIKPINIYLNETDTIEKAIEKLHDSKFDPKIVYFYVVNDENKLTGVVSTRKLLFSKKDKLISDIFDKNVIKVKETELLKNAMELFSTYGLLALPVVDIENKLLGVIDIDVCIDESFDIRSSALRQEVFQLIGITLEDEKKVSFFKNYKLRMPWILCSMLGGIICAIVSRINQSVLSQFLVLAMFIPLVLTLSESASMQSMTHVLHFIRRPRFSYKNSLLKAFKEFILLFLIALSCGILVGIISLFWGEGALPSFVIGLGIIISIIVSSIFAVVFPAILHKSKLDPKVASGPVVLMLADILTTIIYLGLASFFLL